jgi:hypothetical protein
VASVTLNMHCHGGTARMACSKHDTLRVENLCCDSQVRYQKGCHIVSCTDAILALQLQASRLQAHVMNRHVNRLGSSLQ